MCLSKNLVSIILASLACAIASAHETLTVAVTHSLAIARPAQMIALPWSDVTTALANAHVQKLIITDGTGQTLPYQVIKPDHDAKGIAAGFTELLFQYDFKAGEQRAVFTIKKANAIVPPFPSKTCARIAPERLDDFAWENDRIGHRAYGPALSEPDVNGIGKEVLTASGIDIWSKRVRYCVIDRWYNRGNYHDDDGEGLDMYKTGNTRGTGGTGIWDGTKLHTSGNFTRWKILANGPIRTIFELSYAPWEANGSKVSEVKRFTVDAGHNLDMIESTFSFADVKELTVALGISRNGAEKHEFVAPAEVFRHAASKTLTQWQVQKTNGGMGYAVIIPGDFQGYGEDAGNQLIFTKALAGRPLRYFAGAGWTKSGDFTQKEDWLDYIAAEAARVNSPITITLSKN